MSRVRRKVQPDRARSSGVLLHVTSLPGRHGIGDFGPEARRWIDLLASAGQRWWQILPLGPIGAGNSPYQCYSAFAGYPMLISLDRLVADGLLTPAEERRCRLPAGDRVDYARATQTKRPALRTAAERFSRHRHRKLAGEFARFRSSQAHWLDDYALFSVLQARYAVDWTTWPVDLVRRHRPALAEVRRELAAEIDCERVTQFLFYRQLAQLRDYAHSKGVRIIGDMPIFVSASSADVWTRPELFELDAKLRPTAVAGVPPDLFSADGQRWGNPLYNWPAMRRERYSWWIDRFRAALLQADLIRLDHFRGFEAYWRVPMKSKTAKSGRWIRGPGEHFFQVVRKKLGALPLIAEDLGVITPEVEKLRDQFEFPGMRIVGEFAFSGDASNPHLPHNFVRNCLAYTGTHDNATVAGWHASAKRSERVTLRRYTNDNTDDPVWAVIRLTQQSVAKIAIILAQDLLSLGNEARMNRPGTAEGNWEWRLEEFNTLRRALDRLHRLCSTYGRA